MSGHDKRQQEQIAMANGSKQLTRNNSKRRQQMGIHSVQVNQKSMMVAPTTDAHWVAQLNSDSITHVSLTSDQFIDIDEEFYWWLLVSWTKIHTDN